MIRAANPNWEYRFYDDDAAGFISTNYGPRVLRYYDRINDKYGPARADLFRYLLLYKCGGAYFDIKSSPAKPLDEILLSDDRYLLSRWNNQPGRDNPFAGWGLHPELRSAPGGEFQQWHIVAAPGHPFLKAAIERVLGNIDRYDPDLHGTGFRGVLRTTGPIAYTLAIAPLLHSHQHRFADSQHDLGFVYSIFAARNQSHKTKDTTHYKTLHEPLVVRAGPKAMFGRVRGVILRRLGLL